MASGTRELTLKLVAQTQDMQKGLDGINSKMGGFMKGLVATGGAMAAAFATDQLVQFGKAALDEASNIAESQSKIQQVFGKSSKEVIKFGKDANKSMGLADEEALSYLGTMGAMFTGLGKTQEESVGLSESTLQLAADLGSFNNVSTPETLDMMSAAFRGEYDSIQRMLPGLNAATVEQEALAQTHKTSAKDLTQTEKAMATLSLMYKQAGPAVGDFARTSDGAANQQKILAANMEDLKGKVGNALLPAFNAVLKFINNDLLPALSTAWHWIGEVFAPAVVDAWNFIWVYIGPPIQNIIGMVEGLWTILLNFVQLVVNVFTGDWKGAWDNVKNIFKGAWQYISNLFQLYWKYIQAVWNGILEVLKFVGRWIWDAITSPFRDAWNFLSFIVAVIKGGVIDAWNGMLNWVKGVGSSIYSALTSPFERAWDFIRRTWNNTLGKINFTVPGWIPGIGGNKFQFPQLAKGGIVTSPTLALIGEAGPEAVVPLGKMGMGGTVLNIHVNAGVGDPVEIGRKVAQYLGAFELVNGPRRVRTP